MKTLYGKGSDGKLLVWSIYTNGDTYVVKFGKLGGKIQDKVTACKPKNTGRANATTAEQQAVVEMEARIVKQRKKGYYNTKEEALGHVEWTPMKLQGYKDHSHKIVWPAFVQPKLNGQRVLVRTCGCAVSKQGETLEIPPHIQEDLDYISARMGVDFLGADGEIYAGLASQGGLSLQRIISAFRKENPDTPKLKLYIYDVPKPNEPFNTRLQRLHTLEDFIKEHNLQSLVVVKTKIVLGPADLDVKHGENVKQGYEGSVVRNGDGEYEFGKRSYNAQKLKPRQTMEARVLSTEADKNNQGVLTCQLETGVQFKCLMLKEADSTVNLRLYENSLTLVGKYVEIEYEEFSDEGVPTKPVGIRVREVNENWEPKE